MAKIRRAKYRFVPSAPAASACGPSQPMRMTSDVIGAFWATFVRIRGQLKALVARNSRPHVARFMRALLSETASDRHPLALEISAAPAAGRQAVAIGWRSALGPVLRRVR